MQRLRICWCNIIRFKYWLFLLGHTIERMENFDQKPFHYNESGSKDCRTLAFKGGQVELKELHSATRARWTACTYATSDEALAAAGPALEMMFKVKSGVLAIVEEAFKKHRDSGSFGDLPNVSVTTYESASYDTQDVYQFLQRHLEPWRPGRRWRILVADIYIAHQDVRVRTF